MTFYKWVVVNASDLLLWCLACSPYRCRLSLWQIHVELNATTTQQQTVQHSAANTQQYSLQIITVPENTQTSPSLFTFLTWDHKYIQCIASYYTMFRYVTTIKIQPAVIQTKLAKWWNNKSFHTSFQIIHKIKSFFVQEPTPCTFSITVTVTPTDGQTGRQTSETVLTQLQTDRHTHTDRHRECVLILIIKHLQSATVW